MQYFVVMIDYGRRGREAVVDPEITRREVISRVASGEYRNISFIQEIVENSVEDVTEAILAPDPARRSRPPGPAPRSRPRSAQA
ncbi:putative methyltransferase MtxX (methanogen marker protein 4) [Bradyrhizobium sp. F1.13.1]